MVRVETQEEVKKKTIKALKELIKIVKNSNNIYHSEMKVSGLSSKTNKQEIEFIIKHDLSNN